MAYDNELYHYGVKGMRWGVVRARRSNAKVDKSFKKWNENAKKRDNAIDLGKKRNEARLAYETNKSDKNLRSSYKQTNKEYKKALRENTTYRKGVVRQEVGRDASRKYLSEAKRIKKQLDRDPGNRDLKRKYNDMMNKHDVERAKARRAVEVSTKRSNKKAAFKRKMTMGIKAAGATAAVGAGAYAANRYLNSHNVTLNGKRVNLGAQDIRKVADLVKKAEKYTGYFY